MQEYTDGYLEAYDVVEFCDERFNHYLHHFGEIGEADLPATDDFDLLLREEEFMWE
jgi:hypothetical protein